jgi:hypothetical protein
MKSRIALCLALALFAFFLPVSAHAAEKVKGECPPYVREEGEPFLDKAPDIPAQLRPFATATKEYLSVKTAKKPLCIRLGWIFGIENAWASTDKRFIGFDISGYEHHGHIVVDRAYGGQELRTGAKPVFSASGENFASIQISESGWGNMEGVAIWNRGDFSYNVFSMTGGVPFGFDPRIDRWVDDKHVIFSMIEADVVSNAEDQDMAKMPRRYYRLSDQVGWWKLTECGGDARCGL